MLEWATKLNLGAAHTPRACRVRCSPKGPKLGFQYLLTYKTVHCVHGIPLEITESTPGSTQEDQTYHLPSSSSFPSCLLPPSELCWCMNVNIPVSKSSHTSLR